MGFRRSGDGPNRRDFEDSIRKAKDRFGNFKFGGRRNLSIFIIVAVLLWLATGFYRVEPDEQGVEFYLEDGMVKQLEPGLHYFFQLQSGQTITPKVEVIRKINVGLEVQVILVWLKFKCRKKSY